MEKLETVVYGNGGCLKIMNNLKRRGIDVGKLTFQQRPIENPNDIQNIYIELVENNCYVNIRKHKTGGYSAYTLIKYKTEFTKEPICEVVKFTDMLKEVYEQIDFKYFIRRKEGYKTTDWSQDIFVEEDEFPF